MSSTDDGRAGRIGIAKRACIVLMLLMGLGAVICDRAAAASLEQDQATPTQGPPPTVVGPPFNVQGTISDGTAGASQPQDLDPKIVAFADNEIKGNWDATIDTSGRYSASGIPRWDGVTYVLATDFQGVAYVAQIMAPDDGDTASQDLTVYESVATDPGLRFDQSAIIVSDVDQTQHAITVTELHTIVNPTDRTFAPQIGGPGGPAGLLVFGLPPNAFDLTPGLGLDASQIAEIGLGFASLNPIFPGRREISFSYRFPYTESQAKFDRTIRYPVDNVRVLAKTPGPEINSAVLTSADSVSIGGVQYRILGGGPLSTGATLSFTVDNLPVPGGVFARIPLAAPAIAGGLIGVAVIGVYAWRRRHQAGAVAPEGPFAEDALIDRLVALDIDRNAGRISEADYALAREALLAAHRGSEADPAEHAS